MENNGIVPVMNLNEGKNNASSYGWGDGGCGMWFMWIIVIFALMGGWGNGWGNNRNGSALTQAELQMGFDNQSVMRDLRGVQNGLCDGFYAMNTTMLQGQAGLEKSLMQNTYSLGQQLSENRFAQQQCCCETQKSIAAMSAENYKNTCEVVNAINADGEKTRALMVANQIQDLRDKLADRDRDLQTATFQLSQVAQTANIVGSLRPTPIPAYITCSPYQAATCRYASSGTGTTATTTA